MSSLSSVQATPVGCGLAAFVSPCRGVGAGQCFGGWQKAVLCVCTVLGAHLAPPVPQCAPRAGVPANWRN